MLDALICHFANNVTTPSTRTDNLNCGNECVLLGHVEVGRNAKLKRVIVDKHVRIPEGARIGYDLERDRKRFFVSDLGVVVIPKRAKVEA